MSEELNTNQEEFIPPCIEHQNKQDLTLQELGIQISNYYKENPITLKSEDLDVMRKLELSINLASNSLVELEIKKQEVLQDLQEQIKGKRDLYTIVRDKYKIPCQYDIDLETGKINLNWRSILPKI